MLSIAARSSTCRAVCSASSPAARNTATRRALLSTSTAPNPARRVISRRAWQAHAKALPKKPSPKKVNPDDKPWPRSFQIAGAVAGGIFIPYASIWLITANPSLREWFEDYLPMEKLRSHFGDVEWDVQSYVDKNENSKEVGYYQFPQETPYQQRQQQVRIQAMDRSSVTANLYELGDQELQHTKQVPAATRANHKALSELLGSQEVKTVAVEFEEDLTDSQELSQDDGVDSFTFLEDHDPTLPLLQETHTFSSWYYISGQQEQQETATDRDMEQSRLEYTISELERDLADINCTRDIDDMRTEMRQAKQDLSTLKWRRRLGMK